MTLIDYSTILNIGKTFSIIFVICLALCLFLYFCVQFDYFVNKQSYPAKGSVCVFVTAHPDDECMFFGPAILNALKRSPNDVHILCLTTGNYDKKGAVRRKELQESCRVLGIPPNNVDIWDNGSFQDGQEWEFSVLLPKMTEYMEKMKPDYVFTFDDYGVSGHSNHIDTCKAVRLVTQELKKQQKLKALYELESVPLYRKYISLLDLRMSLMQSHLEFVSSPNDILKVQTAMFAHKSQLVWFRHLYIVFSRYMLINTYKDVVIIKP